LGIVDRRYEVRPVIAAGQQSTVGSQKSQLSLFPGDGRGQTYHQYSKHFATVGIIAYLLMFRYVLLHLCCCLAAQGVRFVAERIGEPQWPF
jgi:hypothetical protein